MSDWIPVQDPNSGKTYYANIKTRETRWDPPPNYVGPKEPQVQYGQSTLSMLQSDSSVSSFYSNNNPSMQNLNNQGYQQAPSVSNFNKQQYPSQQSLSSQTNFNKQQQQQQQPLKTGPSKNISNANVNAKGPPSQSSTNFQQKPPPNPSQLKLASNTNFNQKKPQSSQNLKPQSSQNLDEDSSDNLQPSQIQSKWKKVIDPNSGKPYYYHEDTKETTWTLPPELSNNNTQSAAKRLSAQMAVQQQGSQLNFQASWDESEEEDEPKDEESWDKDDKEDENDNENEDSNDGLDVYDPNKQTAAIVANSNVVDEPSDSEKDDEQPVNPLADEDEVVVPDTSNKFWVIGESQSDKYPMSVYGEKYFQRDKHKSMFKTPTVEELLKYAQYKKVKAAIRKLDSKLNQQALQTWKNINSYMGTRKSGKDSTGHVEKLIRFALKGAEELRDEIFIQLCKQTNGNPSVDASIKGWKLMAVCCSTFPPSDEFACYLAVYLFNKSKEPGAIGKYAKFSLESLDRTMEAGQRRMQPTNIEIAKIEECQPIPIKIKFLDGSFRTLLVTSQTRSTQVEKSLSEALRITNPESFGLFEMEEPAPGWEKSVYEKRDQMERQAKIDDLQNLPMDRELEQNERIMDVKSSWERSKKKQNKKIHFVYKCKIYSKAQENSYSKNAWKVAFLTAVWHVLHGYYPIDEKEAFQLAAMQLQATHGLQQQGFYKSGIIVDQIDKYLPHQYVNKYKSDAEPKILEKHGEFQHLDKQDAYRKYIEFLRKSPKASAYFGSSFFACVRVSRLKKTQANEEEDLLLGISENGVIFTHPISKEIIERYKMEEILTYGFRSNAFLFVAGTLMTQKKYQFATMLGKQMNDLLRAQIDLRVQQAEVQGYHIMA